jgi:hypothetical protein
MTNPFLDVMNRLRQNGQSESDRRVSEALDETCRRLAALISTCDARLRQDLLAEFSSHVRTLLKEAESQAGVAQPPSPQISPDLMEWARGQFSEEEIAAGIDEIRQTGGVELRDFIHELEQAAGANE